MAQLSKQEFLIIEEVFPSKKLLKYKKSFVDYIDDYYNRRKKLGHPHGTIKEFKTVMNRLKRFDDSRNKKAYLPDINISWSDDFEVWLTEQAYRTNIVQVTLTRKGLYDLVWAEPLSRLAKKYKISDNGLRKICKRMKFHLQKCEKLIPIF